MQRRITFILLLMSVSISGCGVYSFSGASISPEIKSVSIQYFQNRASIVEPTLSQKFTEKLKDKFISETSLRVVESNADLQFEGQITGYSTSPIAIQGDQTAAENRLTITVNVKFSNAKDSKQNFETPFARYADYPSTKSLTEVEQALIDEINKQLVDDIFNRAVSNW